LSFTFDIGLMSPSKGKIIGKGKTHRSARAKSVQASDEPHDAFFWVPPPRRRPRRLILPIEITQAFDGVTSQGRILADPPGSDAIFYGSDVLVFGALWRPAGLVLHCPQGLPAFQLIDVERLTLRGNS